MTKRELRAQLFEKGKLRTMVLEVDGGTVCVRPKGLRKRVYLDAAALWQAGVKAEVEAERRQKRAKRAAAASARVRKYRKVKR